MKRILLFVLTVIIMFCVSAREIDGDWSGKLDTGGGTKIRLSLHIDSHLRKITLDSPDQGAAGLVSKILWLSDDSVSLSVPSVFARYSARLSDGQLCGIFRQRGVELPLNMERTVTRVRPQTPKPPFPYKEEEVGINGAGGNVMLAGTLTIPDSVSSETPVVVMVSGSGLQNRDEELAGHKPFAVLADRLARAGIASLRYDDRGFGESTGNGFDATTKDFASDAADVLKWVRNTGRFGKTGILGHSEGGLIGYMLAAGKSAPDFVVSIAGPTVSGAQTIGYQNKMLLMDAGVEEATADDFVTALEGVFDIITGSHNNIVNADLIVNKIYPSYNESDTTRHLRDILAGVMTAEPTNLWMMEFLTIHPEDYLNQISSPVFFIFGEKDRQVPPSLNVVPVERMVKLDTGHRLKVYPGLNHLMQHAVTGRTDEYGEIEETVSEEVVEDIIAYIRSL